VCPRGSKLKALAGILEGEGFCRAFLGKKILFKMEKLEIVNVRVKGVIVSGVWERNFCGYITLSGPPKKKKGST